MTHLAVIVQLCLPMLEHLLLDTEAQFFHRLQFQANAGKSAITNDLPLHGFKRFQWSNQSSNSVSGLLTTKTSIKS